MSAGIEGVSRILGVAAYGDMQTNWLRRPAAMSAESARESYSPVNGIPAAGTQGLDLARSTVQAESDDGDSSTDALSRVVADTNASMELSNRGLRFRIDAETDDIQIQIIDKERDKVIRSIPSDEMLHLAARMREFLGIGAMVDQSR